MDAQLSSLEIGASVKLKITVIRLLDVRFSLTFVNIFFDVYN